VDQSVEIKVCGIKNAFTLRGGIMKVSGLRLLVRIATVVLGLASAACPESARAAPFSDRDLQAKLQYCKTCHGVYGQGYHGAFPIPRLAGQQTEYVENQLRAFIERRRENKFMFTVTHVLSPEMVKALAAEFKDLDPKPLGGAPRELAAAGKKIYEEGIPNANVPPCANCHGADAKGNGPFPRLAGQLDDYILRKLVNWSKERGQDPAHPDTSALMEPIAHGLSESQIRAVAAYLSNLE
jgi:cytochrome c553